MNLAELDDKFDANPLKANEGVSLKFFYKVIKDPVESAAQGRPIFKEREFVRITIAGDRDTVTERVANERDRRTYPSQYKHFKASTEQVSVGFPLEEWPGILRSQVAELKYFNIHTVEDLAAVSDANGQKFPMFIALRDKAKEYLNTLQRNAPLEKVQEELKARDEKIALLEQNMAALIKEAKLKATEEDE